MGNINSITGIVRILEVPKQHIVYKNISVTKFRVEFPQIRNNSVTYLTVWGKLADYIPKYYKVNDYILVKGYISIRGEANLKTMDKLKYKLQKKVDITVLEVYPFLLNQDPSKFSAYS